MRKLTIVFHHAGGGHRNAAEALQRTLTEQNLWDVQLLDIQQLLDQLDLIRKATGFRIQDTYNLILRRGWTRFTPQLLVVLQTTIRLYHRPIVNVLRAYWSQNPTDLVLSVIPHFNREIADSLRGLEPKPPFVTLITDFADYPPRFWIERESEYIIVGTDKARQQALAMGHAGDHVFQTSGMILKPKFYAPVEIDRAVERKKLGLDPECPTGIVLFGGHGAQVMVDIARRLDQETDVQLILICGHNEKLAAKLRNLPARKRNVVVGFANNVEYYMALSDFFIGKPGPGSISEALQLHLPVIVECNSKTLPQERYNAQWVRENRYGIVVNNFKTIGACVRAMLNPATFDHLRQNVRNYSNRALFEAPEILEKCARVSDSDIFSLQPDAIHNQAG